MKKKDKILLGAIFLIIILITFFNNKKIYLIEGFEKTDDKTDDNSTNTCKNVETYKMMHNKEVRIEKKDADTAEECSKICGGHTSTDTEGYCQTFTFNEKEKSCKLQLYSPADNNCLYKKIDNNDTINMDNNTNDTDDDS